MNSEVEQLAQRLSIYRDAYTEGNPKVSDLVYDNLEDQLRKLDPNHPFLKGTAGEVVSAFPKATTGEAMLSLDKVTDPEALLKFVGKNKFTIRSKIDGGSLELRYRNGLLTEAVSRGRSGALGFVCTNNALCLLDVPHVITGFTGEIRGEVVMTWKDFNEYSKKELAAGNEAPKHPRNVVTGTMRQENPKIVRERNIRFIAYKVMGHYEEFPDEVSVGDFLNKHGFIVPAELTYDTLSKYTNPEKALDAILHVWKKTIDDSLYYCDGIVISLDDRKLQRELGDSTTAPRWAKAFKWQNETGESEVLSIDWETGRTGHVVPIANIAPIDLSGATISRVTLHNVGYLRKHKINVGSTIAIVRAGEIIPKHLETIDTTGILNIPESCSVCSHQLQEETNTKDEEKSSLYCVNPACPEQLFQRILYFIQTVNIEHMGPSILKALIDRKLVEWPEDLYTLEAEDIGMTASSGKLIGMSTAKKIIESINANREMDLEIFIAALGIPDMSRGTAERLVEKFGNIDSILSANKEDFVGIRDFGDLTVNVVYKGLADNKQMIKELLKYVTFKKKKVVIGGSLQGLKFVITGTLSSPRDEFEAKIVAAGGALQSAVSKNTNYLVTGDAPGESKTTKAAKLGVPTLTEDKLIEMMEKQ
jgi:DNA ligase (NAD+)